MIVRRTFAEMHSSHNVDGTNLVTIKGITLPNGLVIDANIGIEGHWDEGAFDYQYGSEKSTHRYPKQFEIDNWSVESAWLHDTQAPIPLQPDIVKRIEAEMGSIEDAVADEINQNPPDQ